RVCRRGADGWRRRGRVCARDGGDFVEVGGGEYFEQDSWVSGWIKCVVFGAGLWRGGAAFAGDVGDDRVGVCGDGARVCAYSGAGRADVFKDDAADGGEYWRIAATVADHRVVHADCGDGSGDAWVLRRAD